jgi:hypothetical protein
MQELCRATSEQMNKVVELQRHAGMQPNANTDNEELVILRQECGTTGITSDRLSWFPLQVSYGSPG